MHALDYIKRITRHNKDAADRREWRDDPNICRAFDEGFSFGMLAGFGLGAVLAALVTAWVMSW